MIKQTHTSSLIATVILTVSFLYSAVAKADSSPAYNYLNIPSSTRIYGLGGINITTVDDDVNVTDQNPALLGPEFGRQIALNYMRYIEFCRDKIFFSGRRTWSMERLRPILRLW